MTMTPILRGAAVSQVAEKLPSRALPPPSFPRQVRVGMFIAARDKKCRNRKETIFFCNNYLKLNSKQMKLIVRSPRRGL